MNSWYVCVAACALELGGFFVINTISDCNLKLVYTHYNTDALIFIGLIYGTVLALNEQNVRFNCLNLTLLPVVDAV